MGSHVGSQLTAVDGYVASARALFAFAREVRARFPLTFVDTGGGFGIDYGDGCRSRPPTSSAPRARSRRRWASTTSRSTASRVARSSALTGVLVASVIQRRIAEGRRWTILIDAGMNDLMRPALYQARHGIVPVVTDPAAPVSAYHVVGPVCESSDDFGVHNLPDDGPAGALREVAILDAGAYGYSMGSRYNGRAMAAEVFLSGGRSPARRPARGGRVGPRPPSRGRWFGMIGA